MRSFAFCWLTPGGWTLYEKSVKTSLGTSTSRLQGYHSHPLEGHYHEMTEGMLVLDTRPCEGRDDFVKNVLNCPMVDCDLVEDEVDRLNTSDSLFHGVPCFAGTLANHEALQAKGDLGSLDKVSPAAFCRWWAERGAHVGIFRDGKIIFPPEDDTYQEESG